MKKIIILIILLLLVGCTNYNSVEEIVEESNNYFCYKKYDSYEEYVSIEYKEDVITKINYSYVFDKDISKKVDKLKEYRDYIIYKDKTLELVFDNFSMESYKILKNEVIEVFNLKKDNYEYIDNNQIKNSLFRDYLDGYSCE